MVGELIGGRPGYGLKDLRRALMVLLPPHLADFLVQAIKDLRVAEHETGLAPVRLFAEEANPERFLDEIDHHAAIEARHTREGLGTNLPTEDRRPSHEVLG